MRDCWAQADVEHEGLSASQCTQAASAQPGGPTPGFAWHLVFLIVMFSMFTDGHAVLTNKT